MSEFFSWLEGEAVALKLHGFPEAQVPVVLQCKEKLGGLRIYTQSVPQFLSQEGMRRRSVLDEASLKTCMICGSASGIVRHDVRILVQCDACEAVRKRDTGDCA